MHVYNIELTSFALKVVVLLTLFLVYVNNTGFTTKITLEIKKKYNYYRS